MTTPLSREDLPGLLAAALAVAHHGPHNLAPAIPSEADVACIAAHIGADGIRLDDQPVRWEMRCPHCGVWDFGPTLPLTDAIRIHLHGGYLTGAPLLAGACLACPHTTHPTAHDLTPYQE